MQKWIPGRFWQIFYLKISLVILIEKFLNKIVYLMNMKYKRQLSDPPTNSQQTATNSNPFIDITVVRVDRLINQGKRGRYFCCAEILKILFINFWGYRFLSYRGFKTFFLKIFENFCHNFFCHPQLHPKISRLFKCF